MNDYKWKRLNYIKNEKKIIRNLLFQMKKIKPCTDLYAICYPEGDLMFTSLSISEEEAIKEFLEIEGVGNWIYNLGRSSRGESKVYQSSWEGYEAQGYTVERVSLVPQKKQLKNPQISV